jgi:hypothetical protein
VVNIRKFAVAHRWLWALAAATVVVSVALALSVVMNGGWSWSYLIPAAAIYACCFVTAWRDSSRDQQDLS